jgi:hypothetical protein
MIRIEGIPVIAARLAESQKVTFPQARNKFRRPLKIGADRGRPLTIRSAISTKSKTR